MGRKEKIQITIMQEFAIFPFTVSPNLVRREVFSSMFEVHAAELGVACGLLVVLFFAYDRPDIGLVLLSVLTFTALGYLPYEGAGRGITHMMRKPWYFLFPLTAIPSLYTAKTWVLRADTNQLGDLTTVED